MSQSIDGVLVQWGDRLFYPGNRSVRATSPKLSDPRRRADAVRARLAALARRAPQVMVKVTGGGRGMRAIAAHLRYISKNGRLDIEDELGERQQGREALRAIAEDWRFGGSFIADTTAHREAFNIILSMPRESADALTVLRAAREFARQEFADHKYALVLHDHQAHPHVHLCVRAESMHGVRLNPRRADLRRWRETFAERLRGWGVDAEATRQSVRGVARPRDPLGRRKARHEGRSTLPAPTASAQRSGTARAGAAAMWSQLAALLERSARPEDAALARSLRSLATGERTTPVRSHGDERGGPLRGR